jgi:hypothetical protein
MSNMLIKIVSPPTIRGKQTSSSRKAYESMGNEKNLPNPEFKSP